MIGSKHSTIKRYLIHALMLFLGLVAIVPVYVLLINATRTTEQINEGISILPGRGAFNSSSEEIHAYWTTAIAERENIEAFEAAEASGEGEELTEEEIEELLKKAGRQLGENNGIVVYLDLVIGNNPTLRETVNANGVTERFVIRSLTESRSPRIAILNGEGDLLANYNLFNNSQIYVEDGEIIEKGQMIVRTVTLPNVLHNWRALTGRGFKIWQGFGNSAFIAICATLLSIYFSAMTAYGLHIYRFKGRAVIWGVILLIMMLPGSLTFIGFYQLMASWKLTDTYFPLILPGIAAAATVLFIRQYMSSVLNKELIDAARIDGAGELSIFNIVILPVIIPALAAQAIFTFVGSWNNYLIPAVIISSQEKATLPMMIMYLRGDIYRTEFGGIYLGIAASIIPIIIFYSFMSRYIISGITMGGIKE
ncbi:MAG: carbohydrate ABC transporter permease [Treponema sp.]|nr:carbohydrate ABC transporter permease [Treponema sp.]MCL2236855.1 carbohydrate ABC transporter permease [Treponema sp.]